MWQRCVQILICYNLTEEVCSLVNDSLISTLCKLPSNILQRIDRGDDSAFGEASVEVAGAV